MTMTDDQRAGYPLSVDDGAGPVTARGDAVNGMLEADLLDQVVSRVDAGELALTGAGGFLPEMIKAVPERGLAAAQAATTASPRDQSGHARPRDQLQLERTACTVSSSAGGQTTTASRSVAVSASPC